MKSSLTAGIKKTERYNVDKARTIGFMGEECRVYGSPYLVLDVETVCRNLLLENIDTEEDSVGTRVELDHMGPTLLAMWVEISVEVVEVKGRAVHFEFSVRDSLEQVAKGKHSRFVVDVETTAQRLKGKLAKAQKIQ
ncbi:MAG: LysR family transcriptional regulator [Gammaproteobacteria bacterium]|jgi:predicted thioesterase|nr:LysR family transcriptional regulator [Gammaproteobacteria bacterium]MCP4879909.1 LysR family transcriptional regulator [Gammaproteobacteria bacterium]MDP6165448.1 LysR family transcriptional regulator [Gammaproteobacteria bacterium]